MTARYELVNKSFSIIVFLSLELKNKCVKKQELTHQSLQNR